MSRKPCRPTPHSRWSGPDNTKDDENQFAAALTVAARPSFGVVGGTVLSRGIAGGDPITSPAGTYDVRLAAGETQAVIAATIRRETVTTVSPRRRRDGPSSAAA